MARRKRLNEENLRKAIEGSYGNLTVIRQRLGCTRQWLWKLLKKYNVEEQLREEMDTLMDAAENVVASAIINKKDIKTAMWYLEKKGRARGYDPHLTTPAEERTDNTVNVIFTERKTADEPEIKKDITEEK